MSQHVSKIHLTLAQYANPTDPGGFSYIVTEARNTIRWHIDQVLSASEVEKLVISYTVKAPK